MDIPEVAKLAASVANAVVFLGAVIVGAWMGVRRLRSPSSRQKSSSPTQPQCSRWRVAVQSVEPNGGMSPPHVYEVRLSPSDSASDSTWPG